ncbi:MAG: hypothetical protein QOJ73_6895 [Streptosporangiaceae bacterium]|jgi:hypothetical protein|nr:hypothetical protein [Streptosporangiaceae bacterium]
MTLRQPHEDAVLPAADVAVIRQVLSACADLIAWAERHCAPQFAAAAADAAEAAGFSRAPGALAGQASLAIDALDFSDAAGRAR